MIPISLLGFLHSIKCVFRFVTEPFISVMWFPISVLMVLLMSSTLVSGPVSTLMIKALNSPSGMLLISVSLRFLSLTYLVLSSGINSFVWAFCLISAFFSVLEKPVISPAPESNGLIKKQLCST